MDYNPPLLLLPCRSLSACLTSSLASDFSTPSASSKAILFENRALRRDIALDLVEFSKWIYSIFEIILGKTYIAVTFFLLNLGEVAPLRVLEYKSFAISASALSRRLLAWLSTLAKVVATRAKITRGLILKRLLFADTLKAANRLLGDQGKPSFIGSLEQFHSF